VAVVAWEMGEEVAVGRVGVGRVEVRVRVVERAEVNMRSSANICQNHNNKL
jgi:hypothetical protein